VERVFIGLGSNLGDGRAIISAAWQRIGEEEGIATVLLSHPYISAPVDMTSRNWFTNCVGELKTDLSPLELLALVLHVEAEFGRTRNEKAEGYQDRVLDLDILYYGDQSLDVPGLVLPHPRIGDRLFVLRPLAEIAPEFKSRQHSKTVKEMELQLLEQMERGLIPRQEIFRKEWRYD
jgi:2-amino-4-hydroxy-6-hydroxymethyldihydropteridine diphosphokinase